MTKEKKPNPNIKSKYYTGATGEHLVAAELSKRGFIASALPGGAPRIDILAYKDGVAIPLQVKTCRIACVSLNAKGFLHINFNKKQKTQSIDRSKGKGGRKEIDHHLIWIIIFISTIKEEDKEVDKYRFFICTEGDIQNAVLEHYGNFLESLEPTGQRKRNWETTHHGLYPDQIEGAEDNWELLNKEVTFLAEAIAKARIRKS